MKKTLLLVIFFPFFLSNCASPEKLLQAGDFRTAFKVCLRKVQNHKNLKPEHWQWLSKAYNELTQQDVRKIEALELEGAPDRHLVLYQLYNQLAQRQQQVEPYLSALQNYGLQPAYAPATLKALIERTRKSSGQYCQKQGLLLLPQAQAGDKSAARRGYGWMGRAIDYTPERTGELRPFRDSLFDLATIRVVMEVVEPIRPGSTDDIVYDKIVQAEGTFWRDGWLEVHIQTAGDRRVDYYATGEVVDTYVGPNGEYAESETFSRDIVVGCEIIEKEVTEGDSTFIVKTEVPIIETVYATVTTVRQYKKACASMNVLLFDARSDEVIQDWPLRECNDWSNTFEICEGDDRALTSSCSGFCWSYPSGTTLLRGTAKGLRGTLERQIKKQFNAYLERPRRRWFNS